ncbi:hypothetical protein Q5H92_13785 [Hymenobacter sp. M29]|uniref:DNA-directed DNA polymerase family A palm domain-containing protein n=1 Tax=Hymenobacter mellowenesis TaxID=3063995 RepID=A0ABT9AC58_9BACT|nr:hypothetical protein [Hymenobacter sp. M29]MDO7847436.1 hypothetical protein [Hymenobacter sp. M29]
MKRIFNIPATLLELRAQVATLAGGKKLLAKSVHWDKVCWLLDKLGNTQYYDKRTNVDSYVAIKKEKLRSICGKVYADHMLEVLLENNIIETTGSYQAGASSKSYRLTETHRYAKKVCVFNQDSKFLTKLLLADLTTDGDKYLREAIQNDLGFRYEDLLADLSLPVATPSYDGLNFELNTEADLAAWNEHLTALHPHLAGLSPKLQSLVQSAGRIYTKQFFAHRDTKGGRLHTNVTNLATEGRQYLALAGQTELVNTDIPASQLVFACVPLLKHFNNVPPDDVNDWIALCTSDDAYERLHLEMYRMHFDECSANYRCIEDEEEARYYYRKDFKSKFFASIYYSELRFNIGPLATPESLFMWERFPSVMQWVVGQKQDDYTKFACNMQKAESDFVIDTFGYQAMRWMLPTVTIHDSALVPAKFGRDVLQYFQEWLDGQLQVTNAKVKIKAQPLSEAARLILEETYQLF